MATPLGMFRRLNLNSSWGKCGLWLVNQWILFSLCVFVWLGIDYTLRALICLSVMHIWLLLFLRDVHMLIMSIDPLAMIILLTLTSMFTLLYILFVLICWFLFVYYLDPFFSMLSLLYTHLSYLILAQFLCKYNWYTCALHDCLLHDYSSFVWCMCCLSM